jgi:hypothetical protein
MQVFHHPDRNWGCRIQDNWTLKGLKAVVMENDQLRLTILADKGADIYEFLHKPTDTDFMWRTPVGLHNPASNTPSNTTEAGSFMDHYAGAWQEIFPSGGAENVHAGVSYGQHGEACHLPWEFRVIEDTPERVSCLFTLRTLRTPFLIERELTLIRGEAKLHISESLHNLSPETVEFMWGHHLAFGEPFLSEDCRVDTGAKQIDIHDTPYTDNQRFEAGASFQYPIAKDKKGKDVDIRKILPKSAKTMDLAYFTKLAEPWFALTNSKQKLSFGLRFDKQVFDAIWYWQVFGGGQGAPWFSRTYNIGLEPFTTWPGTGLADAVQRGRNRSLKGNGVITTNLIALVHTGLSEVEHIDKNGEVQGR